MNKNTSSSTSVRFTVDFFNKTIAGTKASFDKASKGEGAIYEELASKMAKHPDFKLVVKEQKHSKAKKQTYEGLDFDLMKRYLSIQDNAEELLTKYEGIKKFAKDSGLSVYPITKKWFLETFEGFDVKEAKKAINKANYGYAVAKVSVKPKQSNPAEIKAVANF